MTIYFIFNTEKHIWNCFYVFIVCVTFEIELWEFNVRLNIALQYRRTVFVGGVLVCETVHVSERGCVRVYLVAG